MKLLPVKELNSRINEQKKSEIDAGLFLAKKVDALRETLAEEQKKHDDYMTSIQIETDTIVGERQARIGQLTREVEDLEIQRKALLVPLDEEWAKVKAEGLKNSEQYLSLMDKEYKLRKIEKDIELKTRELSEREATVIKAESRVQQSYILSENIKKEAAQALTEAKLIKEMTDKECVSRLSEMKKKETELAYNEFHLKSKDEQLEVERQTILQEKIVLADQRGTLERAFARLSK